jgi:GT2 family glycosyltransferase
MKRNSMSVPLVSIIVVNWNGAGFIEDCLSSIEKQTWENREFILVDNGSTDGSREIIQKWTEKIPNAQLLALPSNTGFCLANNLGFAKANGEWIALLNNDAIAEPGWVEELVYGGHMRPDPHRKPHRSAA